MKMTLNPILKWAGGKRWLTSVLDKHYKEQSETTGINYRLVEPFCGALSVSLALCPTRALCNDINPHLINLYKQVQKGLKINLELENNESTYYEHRALLNSKIDTENIDDAEAASLFYYLNRTGFNGLCRFNSKGHFNVPIGRYKTILYKREFKEYEEALHHYYFSSLDFEKLDIGRDDFLYCDPPYDNVFSQYSKGGFNWDDQVRLANWLVGFDVPMIISNMATTKIIDLYTNLGFTITTIHAPRRISCNGNRENAIEMLAFKNIISIS